MKKEIIEMFKSKKDIFVPFNDRPTMNCLLNWLYEQGANFPNNIKMDAWQVWEYFDTYAHKSAKPILHIFFNHITNKTELQLTYRAQILSYPQYKNFKVTYFNG